MRRFYRRYLFIPLYLLLTVLIFSGCGGEDGGYTNPAPVAEPSAGQLTSKEVSGYIFRTGSAAFIEGAEEKAPGFIILDSPVTGENSFLSQFSVYLQESAPDEWNSPEVQEIYEALNTEMANWQPLPQWNPSARLFTVYQDSKSATPLTVGEDGYFEGTVLVEAGDNTVKFEVLVGDNECYPVETIPSSDITGSCDTGGATLKSCPEMILSLPGDCTIFRIYTVPPVNLKEAGLSFSLTDTSIGHVIKHPFYMQCKGKVNYNVAYGVFKAKNNLTTPACSTIKAETDTGLNIDIFTEVVKSCASISGHVGGSGVVPLAGFVYSLGFDAFSCLDEAGNYHLKRVFKGHYREVVAVYWIQENGVITKKREFRVIDLFENDLTGFDLPEETGPPLPTDPNYLQYYAKVSEEIFVQKSLWEEELGYEEGVQKTVEWLKGNVAEPPLSSKIANSLAEAEVAIYDPESMYITFNNNLTVNYPGRPLLYREENNFSQELAGQDVNLKDRISVSSPIITGSGRITTKNSKVLILGISTLDHYWVSPSVHNDIAADLEHFEDGNSLNYDVTSKVILNPNGVAYPVIAYKFAICNILNERNIIRPSDFENIDEYGVIFIDADTSLFGRGDDIIACPLYYEREDIIEEETKNWLMSHLGDWSWTLGNVDRYLDWDNYGPDWKPPLAWTSCLMITLTREFFNKQDFSGSLVFIHGDNSWKLSQEVRSSVTGAILPPAFQDAQVYLGFTDWLNPEWSIPLSYYFFYYMMHEFKQPVMFDAEYPFYPPPAGPLNVGDAWNMLAGVNENPVPPYYHTSWWDDTTTLYYKGIDNTYFPVPVMIEITED